MSFYRPHLRGRLREAFAKADRSDIMRRLRTPEALQEAREITERAQIARADLKTQYHDRYAARVTQEKKRVREENVARNRQLKPRWVQEDRLDPEFVSAVAEKRVRDREESRHAAIDAWETAGLRKLARLPAREVRETIGLRRDFARALGRTRTG